MTNYFKLKFAARSCNESFARCAVASFVAALDPTVSELADIKTAVSEAVTNAIVHGYAEKSGDVCIHTQIVGDVVRISIRDNGCGIEDVKRAMEPTYTTVPHGERAGLGFSVMQAFMDKVSVRSSAGKGTTVVLTKKIETKYDGQ